MPASGVSALRSAGLSLDEVKNLDKTSYQRCAQKAQEALKSAGAHYVIDSVAELPQIIRAIETRMKRGEKPWASKSQDNDKTGEWVEISKEIKAVIWLYALQK